MLKTLANLFNSNNNNTIDYGKEERKMLNNYTRTELLRLSKEYGLYNDYKNCSNQYIIDRFSDKAKTHKRFYKTF